MLLSLKALVFDAKSRVWNSPSKTSYAWLSGQIMESQCDHPLRDFADCTCGIYSSPSLEALDEYSGYPNSVLMLLNLYGRWEIWTGPKDIPHSYVLRSWGAKVVGTVRVLELGGHPQWTSNRILSLSAANKYFGVRMYDLEVVKKMISQNWLADSEVSFDPYVRTNWD